MRVQKNSTNGIGTFAYTLTNVATTSDTIATTTPDSAVPGIDNNYVNDKTQVVTITETATSGWPTNPVSASCIDTNYLKSTNPNTAFGSLVNNVLTIPTANLLPGAEILCSFVNTKPTVQVKKTSINGTGTFAYALTNVATNNDSITTTASDTEASGLADNIVTSAAAAVTITETAPAGWPANPTSASCTDTNYLVSGNPVGSFGSLLNNVLTIPTTNLKPAALIICSFVNTAVATVTVSKTLVPSDDNGKFNLLVGATNVATDVGNSGTGSLTVPANAAVTVTETAGTSTGLSNYTTTYSCTGGYTATNVSGSSISIPAVSVTPGSITTCTFTNSRLATVTITKQSNNGTGSFIFSGGTNGLPANLILDTSTGNPMSSSVYNVTALGVDTIITETIPNGWTLNATSTSCTDGSTTFGGLSGGTLTIPAGNVTAGKNITCTFVNDKKTRILLVKRTLGDGAPFDFAVAGSVTDTVTLNPVSNNATDSKLYDDLTPGAALTFTEAAAGTNWFLADITCANITGSPSGSTFTDDFTNRRITVIPVAGASIACTFTNVKNADLTITKNTVGANIGTFGFTVSGLGPVPTSANITTIAGTGTTAFKLKTDKTTETIYTINESSLPAGWLLDSIACSGSTGATPPVVTGSSVSFGIMPGDVTFCTYTNSVAPPNIIVVKYSDKATAKPGQDITYQIIATNTGAGKAWEVVVSDFLSIYSAFKLNSIVFADGGITSGLSMAGNATSYSYDNGSSWTTTPPVDLGGGYNGTVTNWKIVFDPTVQMNANNASFTISYQVKVK